MPYIIGVAGSVAVGKSTTARVLQALLSRWPNTPKVELVTTDGFLHPNAVLEANGLMDRRDFPRATTGAALLRFLCGREGRRAQRQGAGLLASDLRHRAGRIRRRGPPEHPDRRGLNVLLPNRLDRDGKDMPFVSDFFDFSVYLDAERGPAREAGMSSASCGCARPRSATRAPTSANMPI